MKKFAFSLQKMYDYKKQILESEKNQLMSLRREKISMENRIDELSQLMDDIRLRSQEEVMKGTTASKLMFYSMQMDGIKREQTQSKPSYEEVCRRFLADSVDFSEDKLKALNISRRFCNDDFDRCLNDIRSAMKTGEAYGYKDK